MCVYNLFYFSLKQLSVDIGNHIVDRRCDGDKVGNQVVLAGEVNNTHQVEARTLEVQAVRLLEGLGVAVALQVYTKGATAALYLLIPVAGRELDELGHLGDVLALDTLFLKHVAALTQDLDALFHLLHAHHVAVHRVAALVGDLVKLHFIVERIGVALAHVAVMAAGTSRRTSDGIVDGIFLAQDCQHPPYGCEQSRCQ